MNLSVNLLLESEVRSISRISRKFLLNAAAAFAALLLLAFVGFVLLGARSAAQSFRFAEQEKKQSENIFRAVNDLRQELTGLQDLTNTIGGWAATRSDWPSMLAGLPSIVPSNIQLTKMTGNENINAVDNVPTRVVSLYFQGKAAGGHSEVDVQEFEKNLKEKPPFGEFMELVQVKQFEAVRTGAQEDIRIFDIECRFKPQKLFQPIKKEEPARKRGKK
ncbi:MAG: hypothetical protein PHP98_08040 [Kiritimatiellae bacterium]|jgi:hypothetical protein|nr:hypothetical protein [Kiritimatiellia bacterium]